MDKKIKENIGFFRKHIMKKPELKDLPTMEDTDESKLPAVEKLLEHIFLFNKELNSVNLFSRPKDEKHPNKKNTFLLTDTEFKKWDRFYIAVTANHFDPEWKFALHAGLGFHIYLIQDGYGGRGEIADWINIHIEYLFTTPTPFVFQREHVRTLQSFNNKKLSYFYDLNMEFATYALCGNLENGWSFKTLKFNQAVDDACLVLQKLISRKRFLEVHS